MIFKKAYQYDQLRQQINAAYRMDENECVNHLLELAKLDPSQIKSIKSVARDLIVHVREQKAKEKGLDSFLFEYDLSSEEGIALMCLAEALLRIPDKTTIDRLIRDKIKSADWQAHIGKSGTFAVNAATWGLMLTGSLLTGDEELSQTNKVKATLKRFVSRSSEPFVRGAVQQAMKILSRQFVMGRTIEEAIKRAKDNEKRGYCYSYDMLGEAARTKQDAEKYFAAYQHAIDMIKQDGDGKNEIVGPDISVKLSALHPRYEFSQHDRVLAEITPKVLALAKAAKAADMGLTIDAEEADKLDLSLDIIEKVFTDKSLQGWEGFGLALQTYQKRAWYIIDYLAELARQQKRRFKLRLIKGAYWDSEIKRGQVQGLEGYPVFTRKHSTDVSFIACAKKVIANKDAFYPQFATHNAYSVATILELMGDDHDFEFQCLHGMGQTLYDHVVPKDKMDIRCRIYAPVGSHKDLLPYLVRRLLENGANSSFVNRIADANVPIEELLKDSVEVISSLSDKSHPNISLPRHLYGEARLNSKGIDLSNWQQLNDLAKQLDMEAAKQWSTAPIINNQEHISNGQAVLSPINKNIEVGKVKEANGDDIEHALASAHDAFEAWSKTTVQHRASLLEAVADMLEKHRNELMYLAMLEAGKTLSDAIGEVREAVDFCRYYAKLGCKQLSEPTEFSGYTGETNKLQLHARGIIVCISPWNFPLAIFIGQITAALVTGNTIIAKPAEQTPLIAGLAIRLLHAAGIPGEVLHLLPGKGEVVGHALVSDERCQGVIFTGSTYTARAINQTLANRPGPIIPLIAETGGQNTMIVDSSALPEQVVVDVITSAFGSAGQRCSALRVLYLQDDTADKVITMLKGAMVELNVGDPSLLSTDVGPVIDKEAQELLQKHIQKMHNQAKLIYQVELPSICKRGTFIPPCAFEIDSIDKLKHEVFGPILHVIRYKEKDLEKIINAINNTGYGLTLGIHSRIDETVKFIQQRVKVGNCYVNRNMIGAIVGLQPFGGEGLSGTGPKAGGPHYLTRLCVERSVSIDTTAAGGNASLMSLQEE